MTRQRSRLRLFSATLCGVAIVATLTACTDGSTEAGMGLPTLSGAEATAVLATATDVTAAHEGTLSIADNGCFIWPEPDSSADGAWIVWPEGDDGNSYFGSFGAFCDAEERGVLVLAVVATRYHH